MSHITEENGRVAWHVAFTPAAYLQRTPYSLFFIHSLIFSFIFFVSLFLSFFPPFLSFFSQTSTIMAKVMVITPETSCSTPFYYQSQLLCMCIKYRYVYVYVRTYQAQIYVHVSSIDNHHNSSCKYYLHRNRIIIKILTFSRSNNY